MADLAIQVLFISLITKAASDWVELPKVNPTVKYSLIPLEQSSETLGNATSYSSTQMPFTTPFNTILTTFLSDFHLTDHNENISVQSKKTTDQNINKTMFSEGYNEGLKASIQNHFNHSFLKNADVKSDDSLKVVEETLQNVENDLLDQPHKSITEKLNYLKSIQNRLYAEIKRASRGIWIERQARTKKLMGFGTVEGALMTIAFLTFSVFLIKIVFQFIKGLQNKELMMLSMPPDMATSGRRFRREDNILAAAKILQYMDEFSINHRDDCDYQ